MTTTIDSTNAPATADALAERLFEGFLSTMELLSVHLGVELGLYRALADHGPSTADELAAAAGILMGKDSGTPAVAVQGVPLPPGPGGAGTLVRDPAHDLFRGQGVGDYSASMTAFALAGDAGAAAAPG